MNGASTELQTKLCRSFERSLRGAENEASAELRKVMNLLLFFLMQPVFFSSDSVQFLGGVWAHFWNRVWAQKWVPIPVSIFLNRGATFSIGVAQRRSAYRKVGTEIGTHFGAQIAFHFLAQIAFHFWAPIAFFCLRSCSRVTLVQPPRESLPSLQNGMWMHG